MNEEKEAAVRDLMRVPGLGRSTAETLVRNGYTTVEEVAYVPLAELLHQSGLLESQALETRALARSFLLAAGGVSE